jgi:hypothetical protein
VKAVFAGEGHMQSAATAAAWRQLIARQVF